MSGRVCWPGQTLCLAGICGQCNVGLVFFCFVYCEAFSVVFSLVTVLHRPTCVFLYDFLRWCGCHIGVINDITRSVAPRPSIVLRADDILLIVKLQTVLNAPARGHESSTSSRLCFVNFTGFQSEIFGIGFVCVIVHSSVLVQCGLVAGGQTDKQTDRRTDTRRLHILRYSITSRGKIIYW